MRFVQRPNIDCTKWDYLVQQTKKACIYEQSYFLDVTCDYWCVFVDEEYSKGIAIPFTNKMNQKIVYTPNFIRYIDFLGEYTEMDIVHFCQAIKEEFTIGKLAISTAFPVKNTTQKVYQTINFLEQYKYNSLTKRMLKKFESSQLTLSSTCDFKCVLEFVSNELSTRLPDLSKKDFAVFNQLLNDIKTKNQLTYYGVLNADNQLIGGAFFSDFNNRVTYIKGISTKEFRNEGVMYALLNEGIEFAKNRNCNFDFGGSSIPSIRQFFSHLGGKDAEYTSLNWGSPPYYYRLIRFLYHKLFKRNK